MNNTTRTTKIYRSALFFTVSIIIAAQSFAQGSTHEHTNGNAQGTTHDHTNRAAPANTTAASDWTLDKMPADLETDYALSALPPHLRDNATVYLLDPKMGYYVSRQGSNGYICFVSRTDWEWNEFRKDLCTPISYDAEGAKSIFPVYMDVASMRASGKFLAAQIKDSVISRINTGIYKAPSKPGISYMLAPVMRVYTGTPDNKEISTIPGPHYMLYAPYFTNENARYKPGTDGIILNSPDNEILGQGKGPHAYIIILATDAEKAIIEEDGKDLLKRLAAYKPYFKIESGMSHHHHGAAAKS